MNILFCQPSLNRSGSEHSLLEILGGLREHCDFDIQVLAGQDGPLREAIEAAVGRIHLIPAPKLGRRPGKLPAFIRSFFTVAVAIRRLKKTAGISVVYINTLMFPQALVGAWLSRLKIIVHIREIEARYPGPVYRWYLWLTTLLADRIICVCEYIRNQSGIPLRELFLHKSEVIYNTSGFKAAPISRTIGTRLSILTVIPLTERKGIWDLLRFAKILQIRSARLRGFRFHLNIAGSVGDPAFHKKLRRHLENAGLQDQVSFLGEQADLSRLYHDAHLLVHPSRFEAFPRILVEAANFSLPAIATDAGGSAEAVIDGETGFIVPVGAPELMADRVLRLVSRPELYRRQEQRAFQRYRHCFERRIASARIITILNDMNTSRPKVRVCND